MWRRISCLYQIWDESWRIMQSPCISLSHRSHLSLISSISKLSLPFLLSFLAESSNCDSQNLIERDRRRKNFKLLRSPKVFRWIPSSRITSSWPDDFPERSVTSVTGGRDEGHGCRAPFAGELFEVKLETSTTRRERKGEKVTKGQQTERKGRKETLQMTIDVKAMEAMAAMATGQTGHTGHQDEMQMQRIRVRALALNFFDVVQRLGIMPTHVAGHQIPKPLGGHDFAGSSNEEIFGMGATMSQSISRDSHPQLVALRPRNLTALEAASLPTVSLTVSMAFDFAQVTHGEILLIHAAAGGVGLAAISAARRLGAQLMATAGSAKKMCSLRSRGLLQIASSRDGQAFLSDIYDQLAMPTLVLNSLTHQDFIPRSLSLLGPAGRFVELAKLQAKKTCENWKHPTWQHEFVFFSVCFSTSKFLRTIIWLLFEKGNQCNSRYQSASRSKRHVWEINMRNISIELGTWAFESKQHSNLATRKFQQTYEKVARHGLPLKWLHSERMWSMLSFYWTDGWQRPWEIQIVTVEFHSAILCFWTLCFKHIWIAYGIISIDDINGIYYGGLASSDTGYSW